MAEGLVMRQFENPAIIKLIPAKSIGLMAAGPIKPEIKLMAPRAAAICGRTIKILNIPIKTPILLGSTELESMAYGMDKILPHANPIRMKQYFN